MCVDHYRETELYAFEDRNPRRSHHAGTAIPLELNKDQRAAARRHGVGAFTCMNDALQHPKHWRGLMKANLEMAWAHPAVESGLAAAIGYCFGGQVRYMCKCKCKRALWQTGPPTLTHRCLTAWLQACIEQVRAGHPIQAICSFHGLLHSKPLKTNEDGSPNFAAGRISDEEYETQFFDDANSYDTSCKVLIENGDLDDEVPQSDIDKWKAEMDEHGIDWRFNNHAQTPHVSPEPTCAATTLPGSADPSSRRVAIAHRHIKRPCNVMQCDGGAVAGLCVGCWCVVDCIPRGC